MADLFWNDSVSVKKRRGRAEETGSVSDAAIKLSMVSLRGKNMYTRRNTLFLTLAREHVYFLFKLKMSRQRRDLPWGITIRSACCSAPWGVERGGGRVIYNGEEINWKTVG